jgi:asparagine synthase (glutamine-hydrolysing)
MDLKPRQALLKKDFLEYLNMEEYVAARYEESVDETPRLALDSPKERRRREISWLNQRWFMQTLLNRMDRTSMFSGLEARVPFADHRILEYVWNVPWEMKAKNGMAKALLRECGKDYLPNQIRCRRKSPYPKTYDTGYESLLAKRIQEEILEDPTSLVFDFLDRKKVKQFLLSPSDYGKPWYGQLMAGPQMMAYLWQIHYWMKKYHITIA